MSQFQQLLLNAINALTLRLNSIENNGKKINELPAQTNLNYASRLHVSLAGESQRIDIQQIISAALLEFESKVSRFIQIGALDLDGNDLNITGTWVAIINGLSRTNNAEPTINIPFTTTDKVRGDLIVFDADGDIVRLAGTENDLGLYFFPTLPPNTLLITPLVVTDSDISAPVDPELPSAPFYVGLYESEESFDGGIPRAPYGSFGFIKNATQNILCLCLDDTDWTFLELNPFKKLILWNPSDSAVFELPRGVQVRTVFVNGSIVNSTQDPALAAYNKWTQVGSSIVIANDILFEENSIISIFN